VTAQTQWVRSPSGGSMHAQKESLHTELWMQVSVVLKGPRHSVDGLQPK